MRQTLFPAHYTTRMLDSLPDEDFLSSAFASSDIDIYSIQIVALAFVLWSPYWEGAVLCDEAGMGKNYEVMLVITRKWLEGCCHILLFTPNDDLMWQWMPYTEVYIVLMMCGKIKTFPLVQIISRFRF